MKYLLIPNDLTITCCIKGLNISVKQLARHLLCTDFFSVYWLHQAVKPFRFWENCEDMGWGNGCINEWYIM